LAGVVAGVGRSGRLNQHQVTFLRGDGPVLNSSGDNEQFTLSQQDSPISHLNGVFTCKSGL
jgi:hypothetical protein